MKGASPSGSRFRKSSRENSPCFTGDSAGTVVAADVVSGLSLEEAHLRLVLDTEESARRPENGLRVQREVLVAHHEVREAGAVDHPLAVVVHVAPDVGRLPDPAPGAEAVAVAEGER